MTIGYAVVDTETTGFAPASHRVAEIAIIHMDPDGEITDRWETLINPERDLGPQKVHRISASDILNAPKFSDIAGDVAARLQGRALVAHNLRFDAPFLQQEYLRLGHSTPIAHDRGICTMQLAGVFLPGAGRSLRDCCDSFGIVNESAHCAGSDAMATAHLLRQYIRNNPGHPGWPAWLTYAARTVWPTIPAAGIAPALRSAPGSTAVHFLDRIVERMPPYEGPENCTAYLALLDVALLDRHLSATEANALVEVAADLGIGRQQAAELHREYVKTMIAQAWMDGVVTTDEEGDLIRVADMLRVDRSVVLAGVQAAPAQAVAKVGGPVVAPGDLIVLTGDMSRSRSEIAEELTRAGYVVHGGVTKKVKLVVAADPDSLSGKAKKARDYGIPVVNEDYLDKLLAG